MTLKLRVIKNIRVKLSYNLQPTPSEENRSLTQKASLINIQLLQESINEVKNNPKRVKARIV